MLQMLRFFTGDNARSNGCDWIWVKYVIQCVHGIFDRKMHIVKCLALQNIVCAVHWLAVNKWQCSIFGMLSIVFPFCMLTEPLFNVIDSSRLTILFYLFAQKQFNTHTLRWFCFLLSLLKCNYILLAVSIMVPFHSMSKGYVDRCAMYRYWGRAGRTETNWELQ